MVAAELSLSFDDIIEAVRESKRGRWFLDEFERRMRSNDTKGLLTAISKLESVVATMGSGSSAGPDAAILARARAAIMAAKKDIATYDKTNLSEEGRLFAKLADMARQTFAVEQKPSATNSGVIRALKLVDDLEVDICGTQPSANYFKQDADVFAPAEKPAKPAVFVAAADQKPFFVEAKATVEEMEPKGAKLIINRRPLAPAGVLPIPETAIPTENAKAAKAADPIEVVPIVIKPVEAVAEAVPVQKMLVETMADAAAPVVAAPATPRVVIIRRKPEDMADVPMPGAPAVNQSQNESTAA